MANINGQYMPGDYQYGHFNLMPSLRDYIQNNFVSILMSAFQAYKEFNILLQSRRDEINTEKLQNQPNPEGVILV